MGWQCGGRSPLDLRLSSHLRRVSGPSPGRGLIQLGFGFCLFVLLGGLAMEDAQWTLPPFLCFGCSDALGQGRRPDWG